MSVFNPEVSIKENTNYINASQGRPANKSLGILFETVADTLNNRVNSWDASTKKQLQEDVAKGVEGVDNETLPEMPDPSLFAPQPATNGRPGSPVPAEVSSAGSKLEKLKQAYEQGKMSDLYYQTRVAQLSKNLRAKYPQHLAVVDDLISNATGTSTANKIRRELVSVFEKQATEQSDEVKRKQKYLFEVTEKGYLSDPEIMTMYSTIAKSEFDPNNYNEMALRYAIGTREAEDKANAREKSALELLDKKEGRTKTVAKQTAIKEMTTLRDRILFTASNVGPKGYAGGPNQMQNLSAVIQKGMADGKLSPEETEGITAVVNALELQLNTKAEELLTSADQEGFSYATYLTDPNDRNDVKSVLLAPLQNIKQALTNEQFGILNASKRQVEARKNQKDLVQGDFDEALSRAGKIYGQDFVNKVMIAAENDPSFQQLPEVEKAAAQKILAMLTAGDTMTDVVGNAAAGGVSAPGINVALQKYIEGISTGDLSKEEAVKAAKTLYSERNNTFLKDFSKQNPEQLFYALTNPAFVSKIMGTDAAEDVYSWSLYQSKVLLKPLAEQIYDTQVYSDAAGISYDPGTKRFVFDGGMSSNAASIATKGPGFGGYDVLKAKQGQQAVAKMNKYLDTLQPIVEANGDQIEDALAGIFVGRDYKSLQKEGSFLTRMRDMFFEGLQGEAESVMEKAKKNAPPGMPKQDEGSRSWRNNNPGNLKFGKFAEKQGAVGQDEGGFAIFPDYATGRKAKATLLFESKNYKNLNILEAINRYAPREDDNPTANYVQAIVQATGAPPDTPLSDLSEAQKERMLDAMEKFEGFTPGR